MTIIPKCRADNKKYCNNWDGKGDVNKLTNGGVFDGECPTGKNPCPFKVTPKPSPELKAS
ncbi:MAG: hypothetical protein MUP49_02210 [Dehalococcoidia bacterium]|nr:hypothetical protein [Dehalococcoidia bacterium]